LKKLLAGEPNHVISVLSANVHPISVSCPHLSLHKNLQPWLENGWPQKEHTLLSALL
jgi:hypothetical protein